MADGTSIDPGHQPLAISHGKDRSMTNGSMTKAELVEEVSRVSDLTKKHSEVIVDTVFRSIIEALHRGEKIELRGFGSFRLRAKGAIRRPATRSTCRRRRCPTSSQGKSSRN